MSKKDAQRVAPYVAFALLIAGTLFGFSVYAQESSIGVITDVEVQVNEQSYVIDCAFVAFGEAVPNIVKVGEGVTFRSVAENVSPGCTGKWVHEWDWNNDGTWDFTSAALPNQGNGKDHAYGTAGTYKAVNRIRNVDTGQTEKGTPFTVTITKPDRDRGVVFQKYSLFPHKTVRQNVMFGLELEKFNLFDPIVNTKKWIAKRKEFRIEADKYLERVRLLEHADKYPNHLSGGQKQRSAIAQAMIMNPSILLMDEPFGALDEGTREEMQIFTLEEWKKTKQTVLFVTHSLDEAIFMGTRLIVISQYYTHADGTTGAKIVKDVKIPWEHPRSTKIKSTKEFNELIEEIRYEGLNPDFMQEIGDFDLSHSDAIK